MRRASTILTTSGFALLSTGCTLFLLDSAEQCDHDEDCAALGLVGNICTTEHICTVPPKCFSSAECAPLPNGKPSACIAGTCAPLLSDECTTVYPSEHIGDDDTVYLGLMAPLKDDFKSIGLPIQRSMELALKEIDASVNGIPGAPDGGRRPLAVIACHESDDPLAAARHLIETVKVPAIMGPAFSGITVEVATTVSIPNGALLISPSATSPSISDLDDNDLVWRTVPSDAVQAVPLSLLVKDLESEIRIELGMNDDEPIRVATATKSDAYGLGLFTSLTAILEFNNKNTAANLDEKNFLGKTYDDPNSVDNVDYSEVIDEIVDFAPHIVLPLGTNEGVNKVMAGIEAIWPSSAPHLPRYLFPDGGRLDELLEATEDNEQLRLRVKGTVPGGKGDNFQSFAVRFENEFGKVPGVFCENAYDATYLLAFAIVAGDDGEITGSSIAHGMMQMSDGLPFDVGPQDIGAAFLEIASSGNIDFDGASGALDFDNNTGEAPSDIEVWCVGRDPNTNETKFTSSGQHYDASSEKLVGMGACN